MPLSPLPETTGPPRGVRSPAASPGLAAPHACTPASPPISLPAGSSAKRPKRPKQHPASPAVALYHTADRDQPARRTSPRRDPANAALITAFVAGTYGVPRFVFPLARRR